MDCDDRPNRHEESAALPGGLQPCRRTDVFTEATVPAGLLKAHNTRDGVWALITVLDGELVYRVTDPRRRVRETVLSARTPPGVIEPTILHRVELRGPVRFFVEFYRREIAP